MYTSDKELIACKSIVGFTFPQLHRGKSWYVDFFAYDPVSDRLKRKKYSLDRYRTQKERIAMGTMLISNLMEKLKAGWNPWVNADRTRQYTEISVVFERYENFVRLSERKGMLKRKTAVDYLSRMKQLRIYMSESVARIRYIYQFDRIFAVDFLDYLIYDKDVSATTRNNYRTWLSTLGTWLKDRMYIRENPIEDIKMIRESEKLRDAMTAEDLSRLRVYCERHNPSFLLACMMEYYTFIRPDELRHVKIGDIDIKHQSITVYAEAAKNRKTQSVAINDRLLLMMVNLHIFDYPSGYYLFGQDMQPGEEQVYVNRFRVEWKKVREALNFPESYQFYSLKDSGIRDLANAEGIVVARDQARHSDVAVTNRYLKASRAVHEETKHFKGEL